MTPGPKPVSPAERFWAKVNYDGPMWAEGGTRCWEWTAATKHNGYGVFTLRSGVKRLAHRFAFEEHIQGSIPEGLQIDHLCRNVVCVNPLHLEMVTPRENTLRSESTSARHARQTHCVHGHLFDEANTYVSPNGRQRSCRACNRRIDAGRREQRKSSSLPNPASTTDASGVSRELQLEEDRARYWDAQ